MLLKRQFKDAPDGHPDAVEALDGRLVVLDHVQVKRAGTVQKFTPGFVNTGLLEGWVALDGRKLTLRTRPKLAYRIVRTPGRYCCTCEQELASEADARAHLQADHPGVESPDPQNPSGWRVDDFFYCERVD